MVLQDLRDYQVLQDIQDTLDRLDLRVFRELLVQVELVDFRVLVDLPE